MKNIRYCIGRACDKVVLEIWNFFKQILKTDHEFSTMIERHNNEIFFLFLIKIYCLLDFQKSPSSCLFFTRRFEA